MNIQATYNESTINIVSLTPNERSGYMDIVYVDSSNNLKIETIPYSLTIATGSTIVGENSGSVSITGGTIDGVVIGGTTPANGTFNTLEGNVSIISSATDITLTEEQVKGNLIIMTATGTVKLPAVTGANGWSVLVYSTTAAAVHADPNDNDKLTLDGTALDDGDKASSTSAAGDSLLLINDTSDGWIAISGKNTWTDGS